MLPAGTTVIANLGDLGRGEGDVKVVGWIQPNASASAFDKELSEGKRMISYISPLGGVHTELMTRRAESDYGPEGGGLTFDTPSS